MSMVPVFLRMAPAAIEFQSVERSTLNIDWSAFFWFRSAVSCGPLAGPLAGPLVGPLAGPLDPPVQHVTELAHQKGHVSLL